MARLLMTLTVLYAAITAIAASVLVGVYHQQNPQLSFVGQQLSDTWNFFSSFSSMDPNSVEGLEAELKANPFDPNSFARPDQAKVTHLHLKLAVDFTKHILAGHVLLDVDRVAANASKLLLDTVDLKIFDIKLVSGGKTTSLNFTHHKSVPEFGAKLEVDISKATEKKIQIEVLYETVPSARALQWLAPEQTDGKKYPFVFSQNEAINARSMVPCQDTPSVKATYTAEIEAPQYATVLMSAKISKPPTAAAGKADHHVHHFNQSVPIPSYLIALVAGDLVSQKLGPRSHVWSERGLINRSAWEFEQVDMILKTAESIAGPYVFEVYDLLILPPSFPFGGMENPCLTFVTPTLLAGDRSLVYVVAHEIAHSWTGNLVTNANFEHFWLNEGFTTFLERKIAGKIGQGEPTRHFNALEGLKDLKETIKAMGEKNQLTRLVTDLRGVNPDDAFSVVPYEKGHSFLFYLEQLLGGPTVFEPFLRAYIQHYKYQSIKTEDFKRFLVEYFNKTEEGKKKVAAINWDGWLNTPGLPLVMPQYDTSLLNVSVHLAEKWVQVPEEQIKTGNGPFNFEEFHALTSGQKKLFLIELDERTEGKRLSATKLERLTAVYKLREEKNAEVSCVWIVLGLKSHWKGVLDEAKLFVGEIGRMKFIRPIYRAMYQWPETKQLAVDTFLANKGHMMSLSIAAIKAELHLK